MNINEINSNIDESQNTNNILNAVSTGVVKNITDVYSVT